jgi:signal transduction histidine kinase/ActR/RegA family two-component response regulator
MIKKVKKLIGIDEPLLSLEKKLFNTVCFAVCLWTLLALISNAFVGLPISLLFLELFLFAMSAFAFYLSRYKGYQEQLTLVYISIGIILFIPGWFLNGGVEGSTTNSGVFFITLIMVLVTRKYHVFYIVLLSGIFCGCYLLEKHFPHWATPYLNNTDRENDIMLSAIVNIVMAGLLVSFLKRSHAKDKNDLIEKTEELERSQVELSKSKDLAEGATVAKSNFLANMSHEIRTPLNGIIGTTELLSLSELSADQLQLLQTLKSCSNLLMNIISDILDLSKIEAGKLSLNPAPVNIRNCLKTVLEISYPGITVSGKNIALNFNADNNLAKYVIMDESRVQQILINLIGNAIKFTDEGFVSLHVSVINKTDQVQEVKFSVEDTGIGISEESLSQLFKPFTQANTTALRKYGGTGLGLSICKKLVEMMDGNIWAESKEAEGSVFNFTLPLTVAEVDNIDYADKDINKAYEYRPLHILLAEDNKMNQIIARKIFEKIGYAIDLAENGKIAVNMMEEKNYDLIFMDIQMPEMNGLQAARHIIEKHKDNAPPIIAMTANALSEDEEECRQAGMQDFISKPFTIERLENVVRKWGKKIEPLETENR